MKGGALELAADGIPQARARDLGCRKATSSGLCTEAVLRRWSPDAALWSILPEEEPWTGVSVTGSAVTVPVSAPTGTEVGILCAMARRIRGFGWVRGG